jgi:multidrug efflux pump subunit AcrB
MGDIQVNLVDKHTARAEPRHRHARAPALAAIGARHGANVKVVEVPPGPPVLAPIVAEVYGPDAAGRRAVAKAVRGLPGHAGIVDVDDSTIADAPAPCCWSTAKAAQLGVAQQAIASTLRMGLAGDAATTCTTPAAPGAGALRCRPSSRAGWTRCCSSRCAPPPARWCRSASWCA